jgi:tetratricopeptide (TPR) repeat protein
MKLRSFVVMPFGIVDIPSGGSPEQKEFHADRVRVDFNRVFGELIAPALKKAGCEPFRADGEVSVGEIRTDMFFELVTADVVVADLSVPNPNVYYELGIRDAISPHGAFIVHGGWPISRPFDVAQDRSFKYDGTLFVLDTDNTRPLRDPKADIEKAVDDLAGVFIRALKSESQATGSPLYSHLPGLKPASWDDIETSRARYFGSLQHDWHERVRRAQELHRPGHIVTIAQDAPTRIHRIKILFEAARALMGLCQFAAAEEVLEEVLQLNPDDSQARMYLGIVQANQGDILRAESQLRYVLAHHGDDAKSGESLGYVYRLLWYLEWKDDSNPQQRAKESSRLLLSSIQSFYNVQKTHPEEYLSGYNALLLMAVTAELFPGLKLPASLVDQAELATVVRYAANAARQTAEETGDYDAQFWSAVAISGLEMLKGNKAEALQSIADACAVPFATLFYLQLLKERLTLLERLNFRPEIVSEAIKTVETAPQSKSSRHRWGKVVVFHSRCTCKAIEPANRRLMEKRISEIVATWKVGKGDLAICAGATDFDITFGQKCVELGARLRLLILDPTAVQLAQTLGNGLSTEWATPSASLADHPRTEVWYHRTELGAPLDESSLQGRHIRWIVNTSRMEAENATSETRLYGLILSDRSLELDDPDDPDDPLFFISEVQTANRYKGRVKLIDLHHLDETADPGEALQKIP